MSQRCCNGSTCSTGRKGSLTTNVGKEALGREEMSAWVGPDRKQLEPLEHSMHVCDHVRYKEHARSTMHKGIFLCSSGLKPSSEQIMKHAHAELV